jgi:hypothetical protein
VVLLAMGCSLDRASEAAAGGVAPSDSGGSASGHAGQSDMASSGAGAGSSASSVASGAAASSGATGGTGTGGEPSGGNGTGGTPPLACWGPDAVCCGGTACPLGTHECCFPNQTQAANGTCVPLGDCPTADVSVTCDDTEDCPGGACCTTWDGAEHLGMECTPLPSCTPPGNLGSPGDYPMCNYPGGTCPAGMSCNEDCCVGDAGWGYCY